MKKYICDVCGKETTNNSIKLVKASLNEREEHGYSGYAFSHKEFEVCRSCMRYIEDAFDNLILDASDRKKKSLQ